MANRLAEARSLYLRKHAENPVAWQPWDDRALARARDEDKPIFLSVGYSSCHWCTVMEGEAFSDPQIAEFLNANFVPIKVDREERPDLDSIYMQALQVLTRQGGWPLNIFLTPRERIPFYGGTYFPVEPRFGRPGFLEVLRSVRAFYDQKRDKLQQLQAEMLELLQESAAMIPAAAEPLPASLLRDGFETATGILSARDRGPSFPMIPYAETALRGTRFAAAASRYDGMQICRQRGLDLALGGIYDHVGGGFHRYTVDGTWTVPHFEKMLYDNGQILEYLANLWSVEPQPVYAEAIAATVQWLQREMRSPQGYFYAAQDADSFLAAPDDEPEEGAFYAWRYDELAARLEATELSALQTDFTVTPEGNFDGSNVLQRRHAGELTGATRSALRKLFAARYGASEVETFPPARDNAAAKSGTWPGRIPPVTDTKAIVAWNSLAISGLARAFAVFGEATYWELANSAVGFILEQQWVAGRLQRLNYDGVAIEPAQAEDYALLVKALLDLGACYPEQTQWVQQAARVQAEFDAQLWAEAGGYFNATADADLLVRERSYLDNATPAANGIAAANLVRLHLLTENLNYLERAEQTLTAFGSIMQRAAQACPSLFAALDWYRNGTSVRAPSRQLRDLVPQYLPTCALRLETELPDRAIALVCRGLGCLEPAITREQLAQQLDETTSRSEP